jgi:proteasome accessory factor C
VATGRALELTYYSATRDRTSVRVVDPMRMVMVGGYGYLEAWCRSAQEVRRFRADRIDAMTVLDEPAAPPPHARPTPIEGGVFQPTAELPLVTLRVRRGARWITEYYPCEQVEESSDGWLVSMRVTDLTWARRLVLGLGPDVSVVSPPELAADVRVQAAAALEAYATPDGLAPVPAAHG